MNELPQSSNLGPNAQARAFGPCVDDIVFERPEDADKLKGKGAAEDAGRRTEFDIMGKREEKGPAKAEAGRLT